MKSQYNQVENTANKLKNQGIPVPNSGVAYLNLLQFCLDQFWTYVFVIVLCLIYLDISMDILIHRKKRSAIVEKQRPSLQRQQFLFSSVWPSVQHWIHFRTLLSDSGGGGPGRGESWRQDTRGPFRCSDYQKD